MLLGRSGPYADIRVATDALDNLAVLVDELDDDDRRRLAATLLHLTADPDVIVATGAVIGLDRVRDQTDPDAALDAVTSTERGLDRAPLGFTSARYPSLRVELMVRAARIAGPEQSGRFAAVLDGLGDEPDRGAVVAELAPRLPDLVLRRLRDWCTSDDVAVLTSLPTHWHRVAAAGALVPWPAEANAAVEQAGRWRDWVDADTVALERAMTGADPILNLPEGLDDPRRWWIIDGEPWNWAAWQADDGALALEVLRSGWSTTATTRVLTEAEAAAYLTAGIDGVRDLVVELRDD